MRSITRHVSAWCIGIQTTSTLLVTMIAVWSHADGLSLEQALQQAFKANPELRAARYAVDVARGRLQQAGLWPNPRLQFGGDSDKPFANDGEFRQDFGFRQDFPIAGRIKRQKGVARVDVALAIAEINEAERTLAGRVAGQFDTLVITVRAIALRNKLIGIERSLVNVTRNRLKAGEVSQFDVNTATLELERLIAERDLLLGDKGVATAALAASLGLVAPYRIELDTSLPPLEPLPALSTLEKQAYARRPDLRIRTLEADRARAERALARASAWGDWTVSLGVQRDRIDVTGTPRQSKDKALVLSMSIPVPLFNRNQGDVAAARAAESQATQGVAAVRFTIANETASAYHELGRLATTLANQRKRALSLSHRNALLARDAYRQGQISIIEVVQVERLHNELQANYLDIYGKYLQSRGQLDTASGAWFDLATRLSEHPVGKTPPEN